MKSLIKLINRSGQLELDSLLNDLNAINEISELKNLVGAITQFEYYTIQHIEAMLADKLIVVRFLKTANSLKNKTFNIIR
jgi:hypothetical protein